MNTYIISTNNGWIKTNDEKMALMPFTIEEMLADHSLLDDPGTPEKKPTKIFIVTKNGKGYWEFGEYVK
jgi:hypothetical protein